MNDTYVDDTMMNIDDGSISDGYNPLIDRFRIVLMFLLCVYYFDFPSALSGYIRMVLGFVPAAFFILSGYLVLADDSGRRERILRSVKRAFLTFVILGSIYFALNIVYYKQSGIDMLTSLSANKTAYLTNLFALNVWQLEIGSPIWYVQALLYAYIIIYVLERLGLLRFDWLIALVLLAFTIISGEFAEMVGFNILGYDSLPGNFLTRALPYILLGAFLSRKREQISRIHPFIFVSSSVIGAILTILEYDLLRKYGLLDYYGHFIGMAVISVSLCCLCFAYEPTDAAPSYFDARSHTYFLIIFYIFHPVGEFTGLLLRNFDDKIYSIYSPYLGIAVFTVSALVSIAAVAVYDAVNLREQS